ncbi:MAG: hypothetical protein IIT93_03220, partial [Paludibacteraceae bacterium]|nr:hypothetical protein [Paludibacteraceae bacterium]
QQRHKLKVGHGVVKTSGVRWQENGRQYIESACVMYMDKQAECYYKHQQQSYVRVGIENRVF